MTENKTTRFEYEKPALIRFEQYLNLVRGESCFGADGGPCAGGDVCPVPDPMKCPVGDI